MNWSKQPDLVVIGGGLAGLAAASFATRAGMGVTLLERAAEVGGMARTGEQDGFRLNLGPRALYPPAARIVEDLGVRYTGSRPALTGYALAEGRLHPMPRGIGGLLDTPPFGGRQGSIAARSLADLIQAEPSATSHLSLAAWAAGRGLDERSRQHVYALVRLRAT